MNIVSLALLTFIVWSGFTNINEVARTPGEVVPQGYQQTIQHFEGGIIKAIHVQEGDHVEHGDVIFDLDDASIKDDYERVQNKHQTLMLEVERLRAFLENRELNFSVLQNIPQNVMDDQQSFFDGMRDAREKEGVIVGQQLDEKRQAIQSLHTDLDAAEKNYTLSITMQERMTELNEKGYLSDMQLFQNQQTTNDAYASIERLKNQLLVAETEISEYENRRGSLTAKQHDEVYERLAKSNAELFQNIELMQKLEERIHRLNVRSPARGLVKSLAVNTIGAVVLPGQKLAEIVPLDKQLEVEVKISPQDIGHVKLGQSVNIKVSSYDFARYGTIEGTLRHISATTFMQESGNPYYKGRITLSSSHMGKNTHNVIIPGMTVMADIITGDKTILQYLLKPIHVSLKTAFTER